MRTTSYVHFDGDWIEFELSPGQQSRVFALSMEAKQGRVVLFMDAGQLEALRDTIQEKSTVIRPPDEEEIE